MKRAEITPRVRYILDHANDDFNFVRFLLKDEHLGKKVNSFEEALAAIAPSNRGRSLNDIYETNYFFERGAAEDAGTAE